MRAKFLIFIFTGLVFAGSLLICSSIKTKEILTTESADNNERELKISKLFKAKPGFKLSIKSESADVFVQSHELSEIKVEFYARGSEKELKRFDVSFKEQGNALNIDIEHKDRRGFFNLFNLFESRWIEEAKLVVYAPESLNVNIKVSGEDIKIEKFSGEINLSSSGGDIQGENLNGIIYASTTGGDLRFKNCSGSSELKSAGGDIIVSTYQGKLETKSSGGDITINKLNGSAEVSLSGGDIKIDFTNLSGITRLSSSGGDIKIYAPSNLNAYVDLKVSGGDIHIDFPIKIDTKTNSELKGKIGEKISAEIIASTSGGDIELRRKDTEI